MRVKNVDMQDTDENVQHNYADLQKNCNQIRILKKYIIYRPHVTSNMLDVTHLCLLIYTMYVDMRDKCVYMITLHMHVNRFILHVDIFGRIFTCTQRAEICIQNCGVTLTSCEQ